MQPDHPFNVVIHSDEKGPFEIHRWERELASIATEKGSSDIAAHISAEANLRNRILYASDAGVPAVRFGDGLIVARLARVTWLLVVTVGVLQTPALQLLVVQGLEALLKALDRFEGEGFAFPAHARPRPPYISLEEQPEGGMQLKMVTPVSWTAAPYTLQQRTWQAAPRTVRYGLGTG